MQNRNLYTVHVRLLKGTQLLDSDQRRIGFRHAEFTDHGFELNGKVIKLRGLDRHQTFPFVGQAMPGRCQRSDANILRNVMHYNIVRTSHYPQSRHFLDACDEMGLLVLEEIPGWQHIGDLPWQDISVDNVSRMIRRDWNHPSIILWGVRINESKDNHDFYVRTNAMAHKLDPTRQTGGIRYFQSSEFLEDVFTMNDFGFPLKPPNHPRYLNTEFVGHTYPTKTIDQVERIQEHMLRHARIHDQLASNPQYAGGIGWCAFDYNTHADFGTGDRICYHGVTDMFREPKSAAGFYKSQCDPAEEIVLEPAFHWARGDESIGFTKAWVCSNCEQLKFYIGQKMVAQVDPNRTEFKNLKYAPFVAELGDAVGNWGDLRIEGYIGGKKVIEKTMSGRGVDQKFALIPDDTKLIRRRSRHDTRGAACDRRVRRDPPIRQRCREIPARRTGRTHRRQSVRIDRRHRSSLDPRQGRSRHGQADRDASATRRAVSHVRDHRRAAREGIALTRRKKGHLSLGSVFFPSLSFVVLWSLHFSVENPNAATRLSEK